MEKNKIRQEIKDIRNKKRVHGIIKDFTHQEKIFSRYGHLLFPNYGYRGGSTNE